MVHIAILGHGVVGRGTADLLTENKDLIKERTGEEVNIKYILDIRDLPESPYYDKIVHDYNMILEDPEVTIVAEVIGGSHPAFDFSLEALRHGKNVVTSNKEVVANFGDVLLQEAEAHHVSYMFEASVGGGIPLLRPIMADLSANQLTEISGILNGTTNYILTRMKKDGVLFENALTEAQKKGYAEANPTADIDGIDACRKIAILGALMYGKLVTPDRIHTEGISGIRLEDVRVLEQAGYSIKLLGRSIRMPYGDRYILVAPFAIPVSCSLASIDDVYNGVIVRGNFVDDVMFYGRGAGAEPTASAVCGDIMNLVTGEALCRARQRWEKADDTFMSEFSYFPAKRYLALTNTDKNTVQVMLGDVILLSEEAGELRLITEEMTEKELKDKVSRLADAGAVLASQIRIF